MKYQVGDILRSKKAMIISNDNEDSENSENVNKGEYFIVIDYGEYTYYDTKCFGYTLLSQKSATRSRWDEEYCIIEETFDKEHL